MATDFDIHGVNPDAAAQTNKIFFDIGSSGIPATELPKIKTAAAPPGNSLTLKGTSSEEGLRSGTACQTARLQQ
jgi:hypothetical protein